MPPSENIESLRKLIKAFGGPDSYIDEDEEREIFVKGTSLSFSQDNVEAVLNQMCRDGGWTREKEIICDLHDQLVEATQRDGGIHKKSFEHCVNFAVAMNMPRQRAMQLSVKYIGDNQLKIKSGFLRKDWFEPIRQQYSR